MMFSGLCRLTWLEIKIFIREPLGLIGTVITPVLIFVVLGRISGPHVPQASGDIQRRTMAVDLPILCSILITASTVLSLTAIIAIYREGGILRRLRATPLRPFTILTAHVLVKLVFTAVTLAAMLLAGRRFVIAEQNPPLASFAVALLFSTFSLSSLGFLIASLVPTARFAQPLGALILYPMIAVSGLFVPVGSLPPLMQVAARAAPLTYAVSLLRGIWLGEGWSAHVLDVTVLTVAFLALSAASSRVFRWE